MVEEALWYSLISVASSAASLGLAIYVLRSIPNRRAGDLFVLAMMFFFLSGLLAFLLRTSLGDEYSLILARIFYFAHTMTVGYVMAFLGAYFYGFQVFRRRAVVMAMQVLLLLSAVYVASQVQAVGREDGLGVVVETRSAIASLALFASLFSLTGLATLIRTVVWTRDDVVRKQALTMTAGLLVHIGGAVWYATARLQAQYPPPFLAVTALGMSGAFAVAILRYRMFHLTSAAEESEDTEPWMDLKRSRSYLVKDKTRHRAFTVFADATRHGRHGFCLSRANPNLLQREYGLHRTPILWLTTTIGQNRVPPTDLRLVERLILEALKDAKDPVVLVDGLEYLLVYNKFDRVIRFFHAVRDACEGAGGSLLLAMDTSVLDEKEATLIESELELLAEARGDAVLEDVFVIDSSGLLLVHNTRRLKATVDHDQLAAMLSAIEAFARDALREEKESLRTLDLGGRRVSMEKGHRLLLAIVYTGAEPAWLRREMRGFLTRAERRFGDLLAKWDGDVAKVEPLKVMTNRLLA